MKENKKKESKKKQLYETKNGLTKPKAGAVVALKDMLYYNRAYFSLPDCKGALRIYQERG